MSTATGEIEEAHLVVIQMKPMKAAYKMGLALCPHLHITITYF